VIEVVLESDTGSMKFSPGIFLMTKYPEVGSVKSRLAKSIGNRAATDLYRAFIQDTLLTVQSVELPFHIAVFPPVALEKSMKWLNGSYRFLPQEGANLGERLHNCFVRMFEEKYEQVIALASDSPGLQADILHKAVSSLQGHDCVLGPALDGGYYLIGFSRKCYLSAVFEGISWGTEFVFEETLSILKANSRHVHVLPEMMDIDTESELREFYEKHRMHPSKPPNTMKYLRKHPDLLW
jgi:hypothetical protein